MPSFPLHAQPVLERQLTAEAVALYKYTIAEPDWTEDCACQDIGLGADQLSDALQVLASLRLIRPSVDPSRSWDAVNPESALAELLADEEAELSLRQVQVRKIRGEVSCLIPSYHEARRASHGQESVEVVHDQNAVAQLLADLSRRAEREVVVAHPGGGLAEAELAQSFERDIVVLNRGVPMRVLLQHSVRGHQPTRQYVSLVTPPGATFRTVSVVPGTLIVFDRQVAFVRPPGGWPAGRVAMVRNAAVVDFLVAIFEYLWSDGKQFSVEDGESADEDRDLLWQAILDQLAGGAKDDAIAHRLGLSVRTCRRHIAAIMRRLDADSRFQAGVHACRRGMLRESA